MPEQRPPASPKPTRPSNPGTLKAVSAARAQPLAAPAARIDSQVIKAKATNTALNAAGLLRDTWGDFKRSDRFFKYKAIILASWVFLSFATIGVACPGTSEPSNDLDAHLTLAGDKDRPVYMIANEGKRPWLNVVVVMNGRFRKAVAQVPPGGNVTVTSNQLTDSAGIPAPKALPVRELLLETQEGTTTLIEGGQPR